MKKKQIIAIIIIILALGTAFYFFKNQGISPENDTKLYTSKGTYNEEKTYNNGHITATGVTIENAIFTGDVLVDPSDSNGEVHFKNVEVQGKIQIQGGENGIYFDGGTYQSVIVEKKGTKVFLTGDAKIENLEAKESIILEGKDNSFINNLSIAKSGTPSSVITKDKAVIQNIKANDTTEITLANPAKTVSFGTGAKDSKLAANGTIDKIQSESKVEFFLNANVGALILSGNANDSVITLGKNAVIASLGTDVPVKIEGEGSVTTATTNKSENISGAIKPGVTYLTTKPVLGESNGVLEISKSTSRTIDTQTSVGWISDQSTSYTSISSENKSSSIDSSSNQNAKENSNPIDTPDPTKPEPSIIPVASVQIQPAKSTLLVGETLQLNGIVLPLNATDRTVIWESSDSRVANVNNGLVTALQNGEAEIILRTVDGNKTASCKITVQANITEITMIDGMGTIDNGISKTVEYNTKLTLPVAVMVKGTDGTEIATPITWNPSNPDTTIVGMTEYIGTLNPLSGYVNHSEIKGKIKLTVNPQPKITSETKPIAKHTYLNEKPEAFTIEADVDQDLNLEYHWYTKTFDSEGKTILEDIENETSNVYKPLASDLPGIVFYYCRLESKNAEPMDVFVGAVATADVKAPEVKVEAPVIESQPTLPKTLSSNWTLSVSASVKDGGTLSYQWYKTKENFNAGGIPIKDGTNPNLEIGDDSEEDYYYVEVINTKDGNSSLPSVSDVFSLSEKK